MIYARKCIRCKEMFDIDTSKELCPNCRKRTPELKKREKEENYARII